MILSKLRVASFRGVRFHIEAAEATFGRRYKLHEFPGRDDPLVEDLGRGPRTYPVEGYLVGRDYALSRDMLIKACEKDGPGKLIHPYHGLIDVRCLKFTVEETFRDGDYARVRFEFLEAPATPIGVPVIDRALDLVAKADKLFTESAARFAEAYSIVGMPAFIARSAEALVLKVCAFMTSSNGLGVFNAATKDLASALADFRRDAVELVHSPLRLLSGFVGAFSFLAEASGLRDMGEAVFAVTRELRRLPLPEPRTVLSGRERDNQVALIRAVHESAIVEAAKRLARAARDERPSDVRASAVDIKRETEVARAETTSDDVFIALLDLEAASVALVAELVVAGRVVTEIPKPALVLSYEIYGDLDHEDKIIAAHGVRHPGFVPQGTVIEARP